MHAKPAELATRLFDRLINAAEQLQIPDEVEIKRLERDAKALLKVDPHAAYQILGGVAALTWDLDGIRKNHEASLRFAKTASTFANYATSLQLIGYFKDASHYMEEASKRQPENLTYLNSAISYALWDGNFTKGLELALELAKRDPENKSNQKRASKRLELIEEALEVCKTQGIRQDDVRRAMALAFELLRGKKIRYSHNGLLVDHDQDTVFLTISIERPLKDVMALDAEFAEKMAAEMPELSSALVVQMEPEPKQSAARANAGSSARIS